MRSVLGLCARLGRVCGGHGAGWVPACGVLGWMGGVSAGARRGERGRTSERPANSWRDPARRVPERSLGFLVRTWIRMGRPHRGCMQDALRARAPREKSGRLSSQQKGFCGETHWLSAGNAPREPLLEAEEAPNAEMKLSCSATELRPALGFQ
jgi:hypothetical protein